MDPIHLDSATEEDLLSLPGVGGSSAKKIVQYLKVHKSIKTLAELQSCAPQIQIANFQMLHTEGSWTSEFQEFVQVQQKELPSKEEDVANDPGDARDSLAREQ